MSRPYLQQLPLKWKCEKRRPGNIWNERTDDHLVQHDNDQVVIAPTVWSSPCIASMQPAHMSHCSFVAAPPPPSPKPHHSNANPCPEHKGSLCEVFTYPHPPPRSHPSQPLSPSVADVLHLLDDGLSGTRQKFTHLSCSHGREAGLTLLGCSGATSHVPLLAAGPPASLHYNLSPHLRRATPLLS